MNAALRATARFGQCRRPGLVAERVGQLHAGRVCRVHIGLQLGERDGRRGQGPSAPVDPVEGVLPALVDQAAVGGPPILDETVAVRVAVGVDPLERAVRGRQQRGHLGLGQPAPVRLPQQRDEQRGRVGRPVVGAAATEGQRTLRAQPHLVQDAAGLFLGQRVSREPW